MKRIYIYYGTDGEYSTGATAELAESAAKEVFAVMYSSCVDEIWCEFQRRIQAHAIKEHSAHTLWADLMLALEINGCMPFTCYRKINEAQWACTERCIVGKETAQEVIRG